MKLVTAEQMRELEQAAVRAGISEAALMEHAGLAAAQEAWMAVGAVEGRAMLVLVGPGNNGGDGLVAALQLAQMGAEVGIYLLKDRDADDPQWQAVVEAGIAANGVEQDPELVALRGMLGQSSLVLDALLGTGASRAIEGDMAEVLARLRAARERSPRPQLIALDLPSGLVMAPRGLQQQGAVVEADGIGGMHHAASIAGDLHRLAEERLGLGVPGHVLVNRSEIVQRCRGLRLILANLIFS